MTRPTLYTKWSHRSRAGAPPPVGCASPLPQSCSSQGCGTRVNLHLLVRGVIRPAQGLPGVMRLGLGQAQELVKLNLEGPKRGRGEGTGGLGWGESLPSPPQGEQGGSFLRQGPYLTCPPRLALAEGSDPGPAKAHCFNPIVGERSSQPPGWAPSTVGDVLGPPARGQLNPGSSFPPQRLPGDPTSGAGGRIPEVRCGMLGEGCLHLLVRGCSSCSLRLPFRLGDIRHLSQAPGPPPVTLG